MKITTKDPKRIRKNNAILGPLQRMSAEMLEGALSAFFSDDQFSRGVIDAMSGRRGQYDMDIMFPGMSDQIPTEYKGAIYEHVSDIVRIRDRVKNRPDEPAGRFLSDGHAVNELKAMFRTSLKRLRRPKLKSGFGRILLDKSDTVWVLRKKREISIRTTVSSLYHMTRPIHDGMTMCLLNHLHSNTDMFLVGMDEPVIHEDERMGRVIEFFGAFYKENGKLGEKDVVWGWSNVIGPFEGKFMFGLGSTPEDARESAKRHLTSMMIKESEKANAD